MRIIEKKLTQIHPYENNPRKNDKSVPLVANSIKEFGFKVPIVIDAEGTIVTGHTRYKAAQYLEMDKVPCILADDLTPEQVRAFRLADNKVGEGSEWDFDLLGDELAGFNDIDMRLFGFEFDDDSVKEDDYEPEIPEEPKSKPGEMYALGRHRLLCGDSTKLDDVVMLTGGAAMDMLLTDPPYNVNYEGTAGKIQNDNMDADSFRRFLTDAFTAARSVMKVGAAFHIWHADSEGYNFRGACLDAGFKIRQCLIWCKNSLVLGRQDFQWKHEPCLYGENPPAFPEEEEFEEYNTVALYGWKDGGRHYFFKNRKQTTLLYFDRPVASREHPTMKPILLFDYEMKCNTREGENVLDLFAGSGTTIMAAEQNGRTAYCMEYDPRYVDVIIDRWETFTGQKARRI